MEEPQGQEVLEETRTPQSVVILKFRQARSRGAMDAAALRALQEHVRLFCQGDLDPKPDASLYFPGLERFDGSGLSIQMA